LMIKEAENEIQFDELELQRKLLDYKYALMVYEFEKFYVDRNLEEQITNAEIEKYYQKNKDNFILKQNLIKGLFIKLPKEAPRTNRLKKMMLSKSDQDFEDLRSYCYRFATKYVLEDTIWLNFDEVFQGTPIQNLEDQERYLRENQYVETKDENFLYFIRIDEYRLKEQISPLEFEIENIINLILNKRKADLANQLEEDIYNEAVKKNEFEILKIILIAFTRKFNWGYFDLYESESIGQFGFGFSLILLDKYGDIYRTSDFYTEKYLKAFPFLKNEVNPDFWTVEEEINSCYSLRTFERFLVYFNFIELKKKTSRLENIEIKKTNVFDTIFKIEKL